MFSKVMSSEDLSKDTGFQEAESRIEAERKQDQILMRASAILRILMGSMDFLQAFQCSGAEDLHLFSHSSNRIIVIDALTRCSGDQVANVDTYKFTAHPTFERKISSYTRCAEKPNPHLSKCRSWDVALCVVIKVEALDSEMAIIPHARLLLREYSILKFIWECYLRENLDFDEMTGIPMVFDYTEVRNSMFNYEPMEESKVLDIYGSMIPWKSDSLSTLSYMSMEKMGPTLKYLQELLTHAKRRTTTFELETAFKIFDQLICRCIQLHRFGVVHNSVEPKNIYFGRSIAFDVVYLGNYTKSMILDSTKDRRMAGVVMGGDQRYTSQYRTRGAIADPIQDLESAFYTLLGMIVHNLPWDVYLQKADSEKRSSDIQNASNQDVLETVDAHPKVREMKSTFWRSQTGINRVLADVRYLTVGKDAGHVNLATEIIRDLYGKLRDQLQSVGSRPNSNIPGSLASQQTAEFQFYMELRRTTLMLFRFESISASLCTPAYQKKIEAIAQDDMGPLPAWNISNWCFNAIEMNTPGNTRLSVFPAETLSARTKN